MTNEEYKKYIIKLINGMDETDNVFLIQLVTLIQKHISRRGKR